MAAKDGSPNGRREVLTALPNTRPARRSAKRAGASAQEQAASDVAAAAPGGRPAATKQRKPAPVRAGAPRAKAGDGARAGAGRAKATTTSAQAGAAGKATRRVPPAGYAAPNGRDEPRLRRGDLFATALQAAGEIAQVGVTAGVQGLRGMLRRLPRP